MELEKATNRANIRTKRSYDDACGLAHALDLVGERWAMLILRELAFGSRRFSEIKSDLPGISANVLTQRLAELEERGLVVRRKLPPPASVQVYEATPWALEAAPLIGKLGKWAARSPLHDASLPLSHAAMMMSLETMIDPKRAQGASGKFGFRFGDIEYSARLGDGRVTAKRGPCADCDVRFAASPQELAAVIYGGAPLDSIGVEGDRGLAGRFVTFFPLPSKAN